MKKYYVIYTTFDSAKSFIFIVAIFCCLLSLGGLLCIAYSPRGIDFYSLKYFIGIPFGCILFPVLLIFFSYKIKFINDKIIFYKFFIPVRIINYKKIDKASFEKIASNGQPSAISISYENKKYIYPVKLFDKCEIEKLISKLNDTVEKQKNYSESTSNSFFDFSKKRDLKYYVMYIITLFLIILFSLLFNNFVIRILRYIKEQI